jgi:predicted N-acetyltransferase YhbS
VTAIRPLQRADLSAVAALYANFMEWDEEATRPGLVAYYARTMLDQPHADSEIPTLVYEDPLDGVVGVLGSNVRRFVHRERAIRVACDGPLIVHPAHRPRGVGALLLRAYLEGPQDLTADDRAIDQVHAMFTRLGGETHAIASLGWSLVLAPLRFAAGALARRITGREEPPATRMLARVDRIADRRLRTEPRSGSVEPLTNEALCELIERLKRQFPLRPTYDEQHLSWLFREMEAANVDGRLVRRLVRADRGRPAGSYVMYLAPHGIAEVIQIAAAESDVALVLEHLVHDAALGGALEVRGRFEQHLIAALRRRRCRIVRVDWACVHSRDPELLAAVHGGRALVTRLDGEWWMRPDPFASVGAAVGAPT